tara:strand:- start:451 stop:1008 length:558 start_codon:yes stop_codon:yes gene_type:complete
MAKEDDIIKTLGGIVAPATLIDDPAKMLQAIRNASLIRLGIGLQTDMRAGESAFTRTGEVAKDAADQVKLLQEAQKNTGQLKKRKDALTMAKSELDIYNKLYYVFDPVTGVSKQKRVDLIENDIQPPSPELFKNSFLDLYLTDENLFEALNKSHIKAVKTAKDQGLTWEWEDTARGLSSYTRKEE